MRILPFVVVVAALAACSPAFAAGDPMVPETSVVETGRPFGAFVEALEESIRDNDFNIIGIACATCAAESLGETIPGNRVFLFFRARYAVRMLAASRDAGIEAPIRIYVTEDADGTARVSFRPPSRTFGAYGDPALDQLGAELDGDVARILSDAGAAAR